MKKFKILFVLTLTLGMLTAFSIKPQAADYTSQAAYVSSDAKTVGIALTFQGNYKYEVVLYNNKSVELGRVQCFHYAVFNNLTKKNQLYYYNSRLLKYDSATDSYLAASDWSAKKPFTSISNYTLKTKSRKNRTKTLKAPKVTGVSYYNVYISTKSLTGYKKVCTVKPGKTVILSKYNKKKFSWGKKYYVKAVPVVAKTNAEGTCYYGSFRFYKIYTVI